MEERKKKLNVCPQIPPVWWFHLLDRSLIAFHFIHSERFIYLFVSFPIGLRSKCHRQLDRNRYKEARSTRDWNWNESCGLCANPGANKTKTDRTKEAKMSFFFLFGFDAKIYQISKRILFFCVCFLYGLLKRKERRNRCNTNIIYISGLTRTHTNSHSIMNLVQYAATQNNVRKQQKNMFCWPA